MNISPQQQIILDTLRHTRGSPITVSRLITAVWGNRYDGGPDNPGNCIRVLVHGLRGTLAFAGVRLLTIGVGRGSQGYMIDPDDLDRLEEIVAGMAQARIEAARARFA